MGASGETPAFAVAAITRWWAGPGREAYPQADHLLLLADGGGSTGYRPRLWKRQLQEQRCERLGLTVTVCHDPPGCAKWNPSEHRRFGPISLTWAGKPLRTWEARPGYIRAPTTTTGLAVDAERLEGVYPTGQRVSDAEMRTLRLDRHAVCPTWNYTLRPRAHSLPDPCAEPAKREVVP